MPTSELSFSSITTHCVPAIPSLMIVAIRPLSWSFPECHLVAPLKDCFSVYYNIVALLGFACPQALWVLRHHPQYLSMDPLPKFKNGAHLVETVGGEPGFWFHLLPGKFRFRCLDSLISLGIGLSMLTRSG